jgi:hypothetical protein
MRPAFAAAWTAALLSSPALAQAPGLTDVFPPGGRAGSTLSATLSGSNLGSVQEVLVSGSGVKVEKGAGGSAAACPVRLTVEPNAEVGPREVRVVTADGVSNGVRIWIGRYPDAVEKEPNDALAQPQPLAALPVTVSGRSDRAEDVDDYSFQAGAGETWVFSLNAAGHRSRLDGYLTLYDSRGRVVRSAMDTFERDPRLVHTFRTAGRYTVQVRDALYRGGPGFTYRLTLGRLPVITRYRPMVGKRGTTLTVQLQGVNLDNAAPLPVALPADPDREKVRVVPATPLGPANSIELFLTDAPAAAEAEPNDTPSGANRIAGIPATLSGWSDRKNDRDLFLFAAKEKQPVLLETTARRAGSRLDPVLRVLDPMGKELASNDDAAGKDARLLFTPPATGDYLVEVRNLTGRSGDDYFYRLDVTVPPPPDFTLALTPDNPTVSAGGAIALTLTAARFGYAGEIAVRLEGLPAGVTASPVMLGQGQNSAVFTLASAPGTLPSFGSLRVVGSARIGEQVVERVAVGQERFQPPLTTQPQQARMRDTELLVAAVGREAPYSLAVTMPAAELKAGQKLELTVKAARKPDFKENIAFTVLGLPTGVTVTALTLNKDQTEGKLTLTAAANAAQGPAQIVIQGTAKNLVLAVPAVALTIRPAK